MKRRRLCPCGPLAYSCKCRGPLHAHAAEQSALQQAEAARGAAHSVVVRPYRGAIEIAGHQSVDAFPDVIRSSGRMRPASNRRSGIPVQANRYGGELLSNLLDAHHALVQVVQRGLEVRVQRDFL